MNFFPLFLRLHNRCVLVVGGGEVAARKVRLLLKAGAKVQVVALDLNDEVQALVHAKSVQWLAKSFSPEHIAAAWLVIAATDDAALNREIAAHADHAKVFVNVVDAPEPSSAITPAIVDRNPLLIAIGSMGAAPVLARRTREKLESLIPAGYGRLAAFMGEQREVLKDKLPQIARRALWERFLDSPAAEQVMTGNVAAASQQLQTMVAENKPTGEVYLVGAGPGDPDLLTFRALRLMQQADVVVYDRLISPAIMELVRRDAERIYVGKRKNEHTLPQEDINQTLVDLAQSGKRVLRLKGGDPFIFGRGGEEIEQLAAAGIPFQVVPAVTAASGCAAYAGIPLTHRDHAQACIFVTGHAKQDGQLSLHWEVLARPQQTVVVYMGLSTLAVICQKLIEHGLPSSHPAAMIEQGTSPQQRVVVGDLSSLPALVKTAAFSAASLLIVGSVVSLHSTLNWYQPHGTSQQ